MAWQSITEHINLGNTYREVKKVYSISILYFDLGKGADYIYVGQNNFVGLHTGQSCYQHEGEGHDSEEVAVRDISHLHPCACQ